MSKTILYLLDYYLPHAGGVETVFEQIISRSVEKGYQVIVLTSLYDPKLKKLEKQDNLKIIRTGKGRKSFIRSGFWTGRKLLKREKIDFIHTSTYGGAIPASLLGMLFKKKVLITVHEIFGQLWKQYKPWRSARIYQVFEWLIFQLPYSIYHCVSLYTLNSLRIAYGIADEKLRLVYNGVDHNFWDRSKVSTDEKNTIREKYQLGTYFSLLYFGHTGISKGIDTLLEAVPELLTQSEDLQLIFNFIPAQRDTEIKTKLFSLLEKIPPKAAKRVKVYNGLPKSELRALVSQVDGVIAPSLSEGFGSVHTETLALGTPLITTAISSLPEVTGGKTIMMRPGDKASLLSAVQKLKKSEYANLPEKFFDREKQYAEIELLYQNMS
ncbi:glycosyltransferase family 1 protein [Candidatus Gracilibacteria bacterium]|nr:MAG: glycosyltransferase family 1 protein [Candidatus Gracilibacteria bacterium]